MNIYTDDNFLFMNGLKNFTVQTIHKANINGLEKIRFLKLGGQRFFDSYFKYINLNDLDKAKYNFFNNVSDDVDDFIHLIYKYLNKTSEAQVRKSLIHIVGTESKGKAGATLKEQILIKHESYQNYFVFNITHDVGSICMMTETVYKEQTLSTLIRTEGYPTDEQLVIMVANPQKLETVSYYNDFGTFKAFKTNFDVNDINLYL
jgi:hypothetical protein